MDRRISTTRAGWVDSHGSGTYRAGFRSELYATRGPHSRGFTSLRDNFVCLRLFIWAITVNYLSIMQFGLLHHFGPFLCLLNHVAPCIVMLLVDFVRGPFSWRSSHYHCQCSPGRDGNRLPIMRRRPNNGRSGTSSENRRL